MKAFAPFALAALLCAAPAPAIIAPAQAQALNAQEADIRAFIQDVAKQTGRTFIVDPRVRGTVSVFSTDVLNETELFEVFLATLRANGLVAIPTASGAFRITLEEGVAQQAGGAARGGEGFVTQVFRFRHIDATAAAETLRPLVGRQGAVIANRGSNTVVVADYADNVRRLRGLVSELDQDRTVTRAITLSNSSADEMARIAATLLGPEQARVVTAAPVSSSNTVLLRGDAEAVERLAPIIEELDRRAESRSDVQVVFLRHASAEQILPVLQEIVGQIAAPAGAAQGEGAPTAPTRRATIARYTGANALVISADPETQRTLAGVIRQLDQRRRQVLVEAIVVEVSDSAARQLGVQFLFSGTEGNSTLPFIATNYSDTAPSLLASAGAVLTRNTSDQDAVADLGRLAIGQLLGANGALIGAGGEINDDALFGVIVNAVKQDQGSNVLSTPSIMTLDNEEATILVGQEVPVTTSEQLREGTTNPFRTVQRQDVGVKLEVKPQINEGGQITLFLRQEVSSIAGPVSSTFTDIVLNTREIETTVIVDDGEIVALGGLLDETERASASRVPVLGDVPVVGNLFRSRGRESAKTNLMVFIRPRIIGGVEDARAVSGARWDAMRGEQLAASRTSQSTLDAIARRYMEEQARIDAARNGAPAAPAPETNDRP